MQRQRLRFLRERVVVATSLPKQRDRRVQERNRTSEAVAAPAIKRIDRARDKGSQLSGRIRSRITTAGILFKKWQTCYWMFQEPAIILVFKSQDYMNQFKETRKGKFVSLSVDFDTAGLFHNALQDGSKGVPIKLVSTRMKYAITEVHTKLYGDEVLHTFKLERWTNVGVDIIAAFASDQPAELVSLHRIMHDCIQLVIPPKKKKSLQQQPYQNTHGGMDGQTHAMTEMSETLASLSFETTTVRPSDSNHRSRGQSYIT